MNIKTTLPGKSMITVHCEDGRTVQVDVGTDALVQLMVALVQVLEESPEARRGLRSVAGLPAEGGEK